MIETRLMISGLQKQRNLLAGLIAEIETRQALGLADLNFCEERTRRVASNLRKLREIKSRYFSSWDILELS